MRRDDDARALAQAIQFLIERDELPEFQSLTKANQAAVLAIVPLINTPEKRAALATYLDRANTPEKRVRMADGLAIVGWLGRIRGVGRLLSSSTVQIATAAAVMATFREDAKDIWTWLSGLVFSGKP